MLNHRVLAGGLALIASLSGLGCHSTGGSFLVFGGSSEPQEDLVDAVAGARGELAGTQEDFAVSLHLFQRLTTPQAVELEELSDEFEDALSACQERASDLQERIESVKSESDHLLQGWTTELEQYSFEAMRKKSEAQMKDTQVRSERVQASLASVQEHMEPVLKKLTDYELFFHHNLNARAIATLGDTYKEFDSEFKALDAEVTKAKAEVEAFLKAFAVEPAPVPAPAK